MCRISGCVNYLLYEFSRVANHGKRGGPDYTGITIDKVTDKNVMFAHNLLSIVGNQKQPINNGANIITYAGEWYNYKDFYPNESSDTVAFLKHIQAKGFYSALQDINGMFAIAWYDQVTKKVLLAVDRFSQKSIYYYREDDKFAFASSPGALLHLKPKWEIDKEAMQSYWLLGSCMGSMWKGIKKLGAAEMLTYDVQSNTYVVEKYWEPKFIDNTTDIEELIIDSIDKVKISDVPIHIFLSGGIDSTIVASRFKNGNAIHLESPELSFAQECSYQFNINLKVISPQEADTEEYLSDLSKEYGDPLMAGIIPYIVSKETSKFGRVAISANGADEGFMGYSRTKDIINRTQQQHIFRSIGLDFPKPLEIDDRLNEGKWYELMNYVQFDLNKTLDAASMCHGLEVRNPFLDHRLIEYTLSRNWNTDNTKEYTGKATLKKMVSQMGFSKHYVGRQKLGFSLHVKPKNIDSLADEAFIWVVSNGFLTVPKFLSGRDQQYLKMSALSFKIWHKIHENKII